MAVDALHFLAQASAPLVGAVILYALRYLWQRFEAKLEENKTSTLDAVQELRAEMTASNKAVIRRLDEINGSVRRHDELIRLHAERLAYLEGQTGQPLGSSGRE